MTAKSDRAKAFLNDPTFQEALTNLRNEYRRYMEDPKVQDQDVLEIRRMLHLSHVLERHLEQMIASGEFEDFMAEDKERPAHLGDLWQTKSNH